MTGSEIPEGGWLLGLLGTGGLTAIIVAWLGARRPKPEPSVQASASLGVGALLADHYAIERLTNEMRRLADANEQLARGVNRYCDLMDITQALGRLRQYAPADRESEKP